MGLDGSGFILVREAQMVPVLSLESVQETHPRMAYHCVHQLVYPRKGERIFRTGFVQVGEVYAHSSLSVLIFYYHGVGYPFGVKYFLDSSCLLKFSYFVLNSFIMVFG